MSNDSSLLIAPSIIAGDLTTIGVQVREFDPTLINLIHCDVMDGNFVPNLTIGPSYIGQLARHTSIPLDVHLMIERPDLSLDQYLALKPWSITIHYESTRFPARLLQRIRNAGIVAGISINPATPIEAIHDLLPYADMVLVMSVDPGFYGQTFMEPAIGRIKRLASRRGDARRPRIQIDGGINMDNIARVASAGADIIVVGAAAFAGGDVNDNARELRARAERGL